MIQSVFENKARVWLYVLFMTGFALLLILSLIPLIPADLLSVVLFAVALSVLLTVTGFLLILTIMYGQFMSLPVFQRMINYTALLVLHLAVTLSVGYAIGHLILGEQTAELIIPVLPLAGSLMLLLDLLLIEYFRKSTSRKEMEAEEELVQTPSKTEPELLPDTEIIERVAVKSGQKIHVIMTPDIICLQADGDYVQIFTMQGKYLKEQTMKYFEEHLPRQFFVRVHRSCIVNVEAISRIDLYEKQTQQITLKNGQHIKVSQSGYKLLRSRLAL